MMGQVCGFVKEKPFARRRADGCIWSHDRLVGAAAADPARFEKESVVWSRSRRRNTGIGSTIVSDWRRAQGTRRSARRCYTSLSVGEISRNKLNFLRWVRR